jgi:hypothetical protein
MVINTDEANKTAPSRPFSTFNSTNAHGKYACAATTKSKFRTAESLYIVLITVVRREQH